MRSPAAGATRLILNSVVNTPLIWGHQAKSGVTCCRISYSADCPRMNKAVLLRDCWSGADGNLNNAGSDVGECRPQCAHEFLLGEARSDAVFITCILDFTFHGYPCDGRNVTSAEGVCKLSRPLHTQADRVKNVGAPRRRAEIYLRQPQPNRKFMSAGRSAGFRIDARLPLRSRVFARSARFMHQDFTP